MMASWLASLRCIPDARRGVALDLTLAITRCPLPPGRTTTASTRPGCFVKVQRLWRHRARLRAGFAPVGRTLGDRRECGTTPLNLRAARSRIHEIEKAISNAGVSPVSMKGGKEWAKESNMDYMRFPAWEKPLREARSETDLVKRAEKVAETELAMWSRLQKLNNWPDACAETEAIWEACQEVWRMKSEILRWPDW